MGESQKIHPKKFLLYVGMASMTMLFAALTSALIVKKGDTQNWQNFRLPNEFLTSTLIIIVSSLTIQMAVNQYKKMRFSLSKLWMLATMLLSLLFVYFQLKGWDTLKAIGMPFNGNPSGSFVYAISGIHGFHYIFGIFFLMLIYLLIRFSKEEVKFQSNNQYNPDRLLHLEILAAYWHYIGIVWVYIFILFKYLIYT
jgi:cytochrome c oxidase subunit 3